MYNKITEERLKEVLEEAIELEGTLDKYLEDHPYHFTDNSTSHAVMVACFSKLAGQSIPEVPTIPDEKTRILRAKLIMEEALATIRGLGVNIYCCDPHNAIEVNIDVMKEGRLVFSKDDFHEPSLKDIVDGCLDLRVVTTGTLISCGIVDSPDLQELVDLNNITKFRKDKDGYLREDGKWIKPSDHPKPEIEKVLKVLGWRE